MRILRHRAVISLIGVAALSGGMLAACGDDDDTASTSTVAEAPTTTAPAATTTMAVVVTAAGAATTEGAGPATEARDRRCGDGSTRLGCRGRGARRRDRGGPGHASRGDLRARVRPRPRRGVTGSSAPESSLPSEVCADSEALRDSVAQLRGFDIRTQRLTALPGYLTDIKDSLAALRTSGGAALQPAVNDLKTSIDDLSTAIENGAVRGVVSAVSAVVSSAQTLLGQITDGPCPTVSSSIPADTTPTSTS